MICVSIFVQIQNERAIHKNYMDSYKIQSRSAFYKQISVLTILCKYLSRTYMTSNRIYLRFYTLFVDGPNFCGRKNSNKKAITEPVRGMET